MSDFLPAAKAIEELEPAVQAFAEATGALGPVREFAAWATDLIRYRRAPYQAKLLMSAAEKIKATGLPPSAVEDKLLRAALESGPLEDDEGMQDRWTNLLANAGTNSVKVRAAFPAILGELEPVEAQLLDQMADRTDDSQFNAQFPEPMPSWVPSGGRDNLVRLRLLREIHQQTESNRFSFLHPGPPTIDGYAFTALGWEFVQACRSPEAESRAKRSS
jgi:hypothetical protein